MMIQLHPTQPQLPQDILLSRHFFHLSFFGQDIFSTTEWLMYSGLLDEALLEVGPNLGGWKLMEKEILNNHLGCKKNSVVNNAMHYQTSNKSETGLCWSWLLVVMSVLEDHFPYQMTQQGEGWAPTSCDILGRVKMNRMKKTTVDHSF